MNGVTLVDGVLGTVARSLARDVGACVRQDSRWLYQLYGVLLTFRGKSAARTLQMVSELFFKSIYVYVFLVIHLFSNHFSIITAQHWWGWQVLPQD